MFNSRSKIQELEGLLRVKDAEIEFYKERGNRYFDAVADIDQKIKEKGILLDKLMDMCEKIIISKKNLT